jgi:hypothetical protein
VRRVELVWLDVVEVSGRPRHGGDDRGERYAREDHSFGQSFHRVTPRRRGLGLSEWSGSLRRTRGTPTDGYETAFSARFTFLSPRFPRIAVLAYRQALAAILLLLLALQ